jgi:hypothetical protein
MLAGMSFHRRRSFSFEIVEMQDLTQDFGLPSAEE